MSREWLTVFMRRVGTHNNGVKGSRWPAAGYKGIRPDLEAKPRRRTSLREAMITILMFLPGLAAAIWILSWHYTK